MKWNPCIAKLNYIAVSNFGLRTEKIEKPALFVSRPKEIRETSICFRWSQRIWHFGGRKAYPTVLKKHTRNPQKQNKSQPPPATWPNCSKTKAHFKEKAIHWGESTIKVSTQLDTWATAQARTSCCAANNIYTSLYPIKIFTIPHRRRKEIPPRAHEKSSRR
jgi:hypothetical protein